MLQFLNKFEPFEFSKESLSQVYQTYMMAYGKQWQNVHESLLLAAERTWKERVIMTAQKNEVSTMQKQVQNTSFGMFSVNVKYGEVIGDARFQADLTVNIGDRHIAILIGGGQLYSHKPPYRELGKAKAKRRLLSALGWECLFIPFYEWYQLRGKQQQEEYFKMKIFGDGSIELQNLEASEDD
eukprot:TRINITY_DN14060_c0_g1_i12.p1 TRINITY_DN14060_c0_g1~~TRINITY_DN14060_c0_g1_i12.p1  ORF type:complete len:183 (-),score=27.64 TRINITY_DN14060_c0_g1_i12:196-744(-)